MAAAAAAAAPTTVEASAPAAQPISLCADSGGVKQSEMKYSRQFSQKRADVWLNWAPGQRG